MLVIDERASILHGMERRTIYRWTTRYVVLGIMVLAGLAWARWAPALSGWVPALLSACALLSFRRGRLLSVYMIVLFGFTLGWWRGGQFMGEVRYLESISRQKVTIVGTVLNDSLYNDRGAISFDLGSLQLESPELRRIVGKIGVSGYGERMIYRGDEVRVTGNFYPGRGSYVAWLSYAQLEVTARSQNVLYAVTRDFSAGMQSALPEPQASFGMGLLVGQRDTMPKAASEMLAAVGLTHIIAVSGYNLTILVRATRRLLAKRSKFQATLAGLALIAAFLVVTGAMPSIFRASIISTLSLGAWYFGRNLKPMVLISLTAAGTALWSPLYVWFDIGWYLSFLAFFGVLIVAPYARRHLLKGKKRGMLGEMLLETTAAQIMVLPIILYIFHDSSFAALLANMLVLPLIPLAMITGFVAGLAGMLIPALAGWFAWPARWILTYLLDAAALVARIPHMEFSVEISVAAMLLMYGVLLSVVLVWWRKSLKNAKLTDSNDTNIVV